MLAQQRQSAARYVVYPYVMSFLLVTMKRGSDVVRIEPGQSRLVPGLPYLALTVILGWWGIPWGPIYSIQAILQILGGGIDVTDEVTEYALRRAYFG
jgi:hypothetical protein